MSHFAAMVRERVEGAATSGHLAAQHRSLDGEVGRAALGAGMNVVQRLATQNPAAAADKACQELVAVLQVAAKGTPADARTALTRLQRYLCELTAADSDVAGDEGIQSFRRQLHLALDH